MGPKIKGSPGHHQPERIAEGLQLLLQGPEAITEQTADGRGGNDAPAGLLTDQHHGHRAGAEAGRQGCAVIPPGASVKLEAGGHPGTQGIHQGQARRLEAPKGSTQIGADLQGAPSGRTTVAVGRAAGMPGRYTS